MGWRRRRRQVVLIREWREIQDFIQEEDLGGTPVTGTVTPLPGRLRFFSFFCKGRGLEGGILTASRGGPRGGKSSLRSLTSSFLLAGEAGRGETGFFLIPQPFEYKL